MYNRIEIKMEISTKFTHRTLYYDYPISQLCGMEHNASVYNHIKHQNVGGKNLSDLSMAFLLEPDLLLIFINIIYRVFTEWC